MKLPDIEYTFNLVFPCRYNSDLRVRNSRFHHRVIVSRDVPPLREGPTDCCWLRVRQEKWPHVMCREIALESLLS